MADATGPRVRLRAYRRLVVGASVVVGIAVGIGVGSLIVLSGSLGPLVLLAIPFGVRILGTASGRLAFRDRVAGWTWPVVALVIAIALALVLPSGIAPVGLGVAVALWFVTTIATGILEFRYPEGRTDL